MNRSIRVTMHGAVSVVNAVANGRGSALGISLKVIADLTISPGKGVYLQSKQGEKLLNILIRKTLPKTVLLDHAVRIEIKSEIPVGFGLKSSSAVSSAVALAIQRVLGEEIDDVKVLNQSADASIDAGVSLTGAFDDSARLLFWWICSYRQFFKKDHKNGTCFGEPFCDYFTPSSCNKREFVQPLPTPEIFDVAFKMASDHEYWNAMKLNGMAVGALLGSDYTPVISAIKEHALSAGISGNGPSVVAIADSKHLKSLMSSLSSFEGQVLISKVNNQKATVEDFDG